MPMAGRPVLMMAGGTGGHIFPALAVAERLREVGVPLIWLGTRGGLEGTIVPKAGFDLITIAVSGFRGKALIKQLIAPLQIVFALLQCLVLLARRRPAAVVGMGGFTSGPGGIAAWLLRIPLIIHEQNAVVGLTNRLLSPLATRVLESFPGTFARVRTAVHTGNPVRREVLSVSRVAHAQTELRILILGGSQGALVLNRVVPEAVARLGSPAVRIWHQVGACDQGATGQRYTAFGVRAKVDVFIDDMAAAYAWADIAICRAGASTLFELAAASVPAILVPYPSAVDDHQTANARFLADRGAAILIPQPQFNEGRLAEVLRTLGEAPERLQIMAARMHEFAALNATARVVDLCVEVARG